MAINDVIEPLDGWELDKVWMIQILKVCPDAVSYNGYARLCTHHYRYIILVRVLHWWKRTRKDSQIVIQICQLRGPCNRMYNWAGDSAFQDWGRQRGVHGEILLILVHPSRKVIPDHNLFIRDHMNIPCDIIA